MIFRGSQNYKKTMWKKLRALHRIWLAITLTYIVIMFFCFLCSNLWRWRLLIEQMYQLPKNMLEDSPIPSRCTKTRVLNTGDTPSFVFLESTNKNYNFFYCQLSAFSGRLFRNKYKASTVKSYASSLLKDCWN